MLNSAEEKAPSDRDAVQGGVREGWEGWDGFNGGTGAITLRLGFGDQQTHRGLFLVPSRSSAGYSRQA